MISKLNTLDFSPGIRAVDINDNFDLIHYWIMAERRFLGGEGIVEGFDITVDPENFIVRISKGSVVNASGELLEINPTEFLAGAFEIIPMQEKMPCPENGIIKLKNRPYSGATRNFITYTPPTANRAPLKEEIYVETRDTKERVPILSVSGNNVYVNANNWKGRDITISYTYTKNRVDTILLNYDGQYCYERSVASTSPSHIQIPDYKNHYVVGQIYWEVGETTTYKIYTNHRHYRSIFVDNNNYVWLNGEKYKAPKFIYFEEPENPELNDIWYNAQNNELLIWKAENETVGWVHINDKTTMSVRESFMFEPNTDAYPEDNQTFIFPPAYLNLRYVPGTNALDIIIDNAPLMKDQFTEVVEPTKTDKSYLAQGIGFKLNEPLDRATFVEVTVNHRVHSKPVRETFQRAAIFTNESYAYYSPSNTDKVFRTNEPYVGGEQQLEVYVDGLRLVRGVDFLEMISETETVPQKDGEKKDYLCRYFKVLKQLEDGAAVSYKIYRHMWNYDQVSLYLKEALDEIKSLRKYNEELERKIVTLSENQVRQNDIVQNQITQFLQNIPNKENFISRDEKIDRDKLSREVQNSLVYNSAINETMATTMLVPLVGCTERDFIQIFYASSSVNRVLIKDIDYNLVHESGGLRIELQPSLIAPGATLYINGIKVGEH